LRRFRGRASILAVPTIVCLLSWATLVALERVLAGGQSVTWDRA
jgi:hypothetical protein